MARFVAIVADPDMVREQMERYGELFEEWVSAGANKDWTRQRHLDEQQQQIADELIDTFRGGWRIEEND